MVAHSDSHELSRHIADAAARKMGYDIVIIDVSQEPTVTDCFVLISAKNERQVGAIVNEIEKDLLGKGTKYARREGGREDRWVLLDYVDVVVHVQHEEERQFYGIDRLWHDCPRVEWSETTPQVGKEDSNSLITENDDS